MITLQEIHERDKRPPSVTVNMTCYNHEKYLDEAIRGVLMQKTNFPVNIVIHDDASTDRSAEIIRRYASENPNITAIIEETNYIQNGKSFFPKVLPHLTGKYIAYCECDDFWIDENKLQIQVDYLEANPDCIATYANIVPVNKFSIRDEAARKESINDRGFQKTGEGDYLLIKGINSMQHQLATLVIRNFWQFMSLEDLDCYLNTRGNGDAKILNLLVRLGRVHYFSEELAAYRRVTDEGTSYSARIARMGEYDKFKRSAKATTDLYLMIEKLFGEKSCRKFFYIIYHEIIGRIKFHTSVIEDAKLNECYKFKNIPCYIWLSFPFYAAYRVFCKAGKVLRKKLGLQSEH